MKTLIIIMFVLSLFTAGCSNTTEPDYNNLSSDLVNLDAKQSIAKANEWRDSAPKITSHITQTEVIFDFPDGSVVKKALPDSLFYIAVAPYINTTHECTLHYPSSCTGELFEKNVKVKAEDENGSIYFDGNIATLKHGFFEIWLPRNRNITFTIKYNNLVGEEIVQS
ncbi:MAG: CueP family metal-binding protein, partial [Bacteroidetes bacterium]|nr:CueP family metal-binding protein [Bacteroidota bacterium]